MATILEIIGPVFLIIGFGWLAATRKLVETAGFAGLNRFAFSFCVPALLFLGGASGQGAAGPAALGFFAGVGVLYGAALLLAWPRLGLGGAGMLALDASYGNAVMMGVPLVLAAYGAEALALLTGIIALHSMILLTLATIIAELATQRRAAWRRVLRASLAGVLRNPVVMAVVLGFAWQLLGLPAPSGLARRTLELLGAAAAPAALFCLGGSLAGFNLRAGWRQTLVTVALKLAVLPALVWGAALLLRLSPQETAVAVTTAALPTGANAFMLAQRYGLRQDVSGATVLAGTLVSILSLTLLIGHFRGG